MKKLLLGLAAAGMLTMTAGSALADHGRFEYGGGYGRHHHGYRANYYGGFGYQPYCGPRPIYRPCGPRPVVPPCGPVVGGFGAPYASGFSFYRPGFSIWFGR